MLGTLCCAGARVAARVAQRERALDRRRRQTVVEQIFGPDNKRARTPLSTEEANSDSVGRLSLLASAISSRPLRVAPGEPGEPAWTDGKVVFVDANISTREQVEA